MLLESVISQGVGAGVGVGPTVAVGFRVGVGRRIINPSRSVVGVGMEEVVARMVAGRVACGVRGVTIGWCVDVGLGVAVTTTMRSSGRADGSGVAVTTTTCGLGALVVSQANPTTTARTSDRATIRKTAVMESIFCRWFI